MSDTPLPPPQEQLPPPAPPVPPAPTPPAPAQRTNALAVVSLVCGILGWTLLPWLGSIGAVITGHIARGEIRRNPTEEGDGFAVAGLVLGWVMIVLGILCFLALLLVFGGLAALLVGLGISGQL